MALTKNGKALAVTMLLQLIFGGYLAGKDLYDYNDPESALTVLVIFLRHGGLSRELCDYCHWSLG